MREEARRNQNGKGSGTAVAAGAVTLSDPNELQKPQTSFIRNGKAISGETVFSAVFSQLGKPFQGTQASKRLCVRNYVSNTFLKNTLARQRQSLAYSGPADETHNSSGKPTPVCDTAKKRKP